MAYLARRVMYLVIGMLLPLQISTQNLSPFYGNPTEFALDGDYKQELDIGGVKFLANVTVVYVHAYLDQLRKVDDHAYTFQAVVYISFSWRDRSAWQTVQTRTAEIWGPDGQAVEGGARCARLCSRGAQMCCDTLGLPNTDVFNAQSIPQSTFMEESIAIFNESVSWQKRIQATFYTPMSFRRFPFDKQVLQIQMGSTQGVGAIYIYRPSTTAAKLNFGKLAEEDKGVDGLSGWKVTGIDFTMSVVNYSRILDASSYSNPGDPYPLKTAPDGLPAEWAKTWPRGFPVTATRFFINIHVGRLTAFYVYNLIVPMMLTVALSWMVFLVEPDDLDTRITTTIGLFVALTTLQYFVNSKLPSSSYTTAMHKFILLSYVTLIGNVMESLLVHYTTRQDVRRFEKKKAQLKLAAAAKRNEYVASVVNQALDVGRKHSLGRLRDAKKRRSWFRRSGSDAKLAAPALRSALDKATGEGLDEKLGNEKVALGLASLGARLRFTRRRAEGGSSPGRGQHGVAAGHLASRVSIWRESAETRDIADLEYGGKRELGSSASSLVEDEEAVLTEGLIRRRPASSSGCLPALRGRGPMASHEREIEAADGRPLEGEGAVLAAGTMESEDRPATGTLQLVQPPAVSVASVPNDGRRVGPGGSERGGAILRGMLSKAPESLSSASSRASEDWLEFRRSIAWEGGSAVQPLLGTTREYKLQPQHYPLARQPRQYHEWLGLNTLHGWWSGICDSAKPPCGSFQFVVLPEEMQHFLWDGRNAERSDVERRRTQSSPADGGQEGSLQPEVEAQLEEGTRSFRKKRMKGLVLLEKAGGEAEEEEERKKKRSWVQTWEWEQRARLWERVKTRIDKSARRERAERAKRRLQRISWEMEAWKAERRRLQQEHRARVREASRVRRQRWVQMVTFQRRKQRRAEAQERASADGTNHEAVGGGNEASHGVAPRGSAPLAEMNREAVCARNGREASRTDGPAVAVGSQAGGQAAEMGTRGWSMDASGGLNGRGSDGGANRDCEPRNGEGNGTTRALQGTPGRNTNQEQAAVFASGNPAVGDGPHRFANSEAGAPALGDGLKAEEQPRLEPSKSFQRVEQKAKKWHDKRTKRLNKQMKALEEEMAKMEDPTKLYQLTFFLDRLSLVVFPIVYFSLSMWLLLLS